MRLGAFTSWPESHLDLLEEMLALDREIRPYDSVNGGRAGYDREIARRKFEGALKFERACRAQEEINRTKKSP